jgi:DNA-binding MarR family transcriptional regulator
VSADLARATAGTFSVVKRCGTRGAPSSCLASRGTAPIQALEERDFRDNALDARGRVGETGGSFVPKLSSSDYRALAALRYEIRKFLAFSEQAARDAGIEPQQHQLLLSVRGLPEGARPTIGTIAERLCVKHHTAVALVDKLEASGLLARERGSEDRREVLLRLTRDGEAMLRTLSSQHQQQLQTVGPEMIDALQKILERESG